MRNNLKSKSIYLKIFIALIIAIVLFAKIFAIRVNERTFLDSTEGNITKSSVFVGSGGYGNISGFGVKVGDKVNKGDLLFTYIRSDIDGKVSNLKNIPSTAQVSLDYFNDSFQFIVTSQTTGVIKKIFSNVGGYVTKDQNIMEIELQESSVHVKYKINAELISFIAIGSQTQITLPNSKILKGTVKSVYSYDNKSQILELDSTIDSNETLIEGTPVTVRVYIQDAFAEKFRDYVQKIPINFIRNYLT